MSTTPHTNNFLAPEPHLVARLKERLAGLQPAVYVLTAADLANVQEAQQRVPAVHVIWDGFRPLEQRADGKRARIDHTWLFVAAVRNVADTREGAAARQEAGELIARVIDAVMGFRAPGTAGVFRLTSAPRAGFRAGFMYLPAAFLVETHFSAS